MASPSKESFAKHGEPMALWNQEIKRFDRWEFEKYEKAREKDLINNEILTKYVPGEEPNGGPIWSYVTRPEVGRIWKDLVAV